MIAFDVRHYDRVGSTNDVLLQLAERGAPNGTVVCAREQISGRGRQGRRWHSPIGNLYISMLLRLDATPQKVTELSFVTALAVADTVDGFLPTDQRAMLKWPNDVLVGGAKISGILIESADAAVVIGIGLNVLHTPAQTPYPTTSLAASGATACDTDVVRQSLLDAFAIRLDQWQRKGFAATRRDWLQRAYPPGSPLKVTIGERAIEGSFVDLSPEGALILQTKDGERRFVAGEVSASTMNSR